MSFVERNKAWLLPVLGAGVLAVLWMNYRTFKAPPPAPDAPAPASTPAPAPAAAPASTPAPTAAEAPAEAAEAPSSEDALWADLRRVEEPLPALNQPDPLLQQGKEPLSAAVLAESPAPVLHPAAWKNLPEPSFPRQAASSSSAAGVPAPRPTLEFVLEQDGGRTAWFDGRGYRSGDKIQGSDYAVSRIGTDFVELTGPQGVVVESTNPLLDPGQKASHPSEAP